MFSFETLIFIVLMITVLLSIKKDEGNGALSFSNSNHLRGIFALCIMIFHISKEYDILYPVFYYLSQSVVAAFFFLSGYGLMKGYLNKENYHKNYLLNRTIKLFLPYLFMIFIYWAYHFLCEEYYDLSYVLNSILGQNTMVMYSWFIKDIIIHYLLFYVLMLVIRNRKEYMSYAAIIVFLIDLILPYLRIQNSYLFSEMFCLGLLYSRYENIISAFLKEKRRIILPLALIIAVLIRIYMIMTVPELKIVLPEKILFMLMIICILFDRKIENRFFNLAGQMSLEIYMTHGLSKAIVRRFLEIPLFFQDMFIYPITFALSFFIERFFMLIRMKILKKR